MDIIASLTSELNVGRGQVLGCIVMLTITFSVINLIVDLLYAYIDPRIKAQYKKK